MAKTILVMAGGTGGHIFPALAVAELLRDKGWRVAWLGNLNGMEAKLVPERGFELHSIEFAALRGKGWSRKLTLPVHLWRGCRQARKVLREVRPDVVLGMGGYISFPGGLAAVLRGIPLVIHEQNSVAGLANRVLAKLSRCVLSGFPGVLKKAQWVGNPVRPEISALPPPEQRFIGREGPLHLLVLGRSLGAQALNTVVPKGLALLRTEERPMVVHQAGEAHLEQLKANYAEAGVEAHCVAFIEDMAGAYGWADLVLCRAGALTVAELAAAGIASILVPYPHAVDNHQCFNARFLFDIGAAFKLPQSQLTPESVALIRNYSRGQLLQMAEKARSVARPEAASEVATICEALVS
ncbi:MAG: UDP-N-acetylglucosamine--N-acetylmuramyl-(pentapeptide) pyrophosphoryl-undecaprenol N-acetylglucosamine transferase [Betaproteobacteria bacterium ADurb.Bin341]|nr:MAG: UDP-N-acetylglucosamine--N-acetylmuramyl-(pentapeptide) pyrophosphoryl-undecaprenol N-acetylglucosamine transferase [Betaproteobacteria bacterium ADurb.Bin341]